MWRQFLPPIVIVGRLTAAVAVELTWDRQQ